MLINLDTSVQSINTAAFPFTSIRIADVRFDTTNVGIYVFFNNILMPAIRNYKINFEHGVGKSFGIYLNKFFERNLGTEDNELICFFKRLHIDKRDTLTDNNYYSKTTGQIDFQTEVFLRSGKEFYAAFKIDTVLIESIRVKKRVVTDEIKDYLLMPTLEILQNKISNTAWEKVIKKKSFTEDQVYENYFTNRFNLPILTQRCKRGIFQTFFEFVNNSPSITVFKVKNEKSRTVSLIDKNGNNLVTTKIFGFCDGERYWIQRGNYCYPLVRAGNSFEFFLTIISNLKILFSIDMEKGDIR